MASNPDNKKKSFRLVLGSIGKDSAYHEIQWHTRGYVPHLEDWQKIQSATFRLADSLPQHVVEDIIRRLRLTKDDAEYRKKMESCLDAGHGECWLKRPEVASCMTETLLHFNTMHYLLHAWVIMPNHVHVLFEAVEPFSLSKILGDWKSYSAHAINQILKRKGQFWHEEYWDRYIRNEEHYHNCVNYIRENPVKAGLVRSVEKWAWNGFLVTDIHDAEAS